jgi:hypothetical protein
MRGKQKVVIGLAQERKKAHNKITFYNNLWQVDTRHQCPEMDEEGGAAQTCA